MTMLFLIINLLSAYTFLMLTKMLIGENITLVMIWSLFILLLHKPASLFSRR